MTQCIFCHVGSISPDFLDSNRALPNLHGKLFWFSVVGLFYWAPAGSSEKVGRHHHLLFRRDVNQNCPQHRVSLQRIAAPVQ
jgi:hypothetical protein